MAVRLNGLITRGFIKDEKNTNSEDNIGHQDSQNGEYFDGVHPEIW